MVLGVAVGVAGAEPYPSRPLRLIAPGFPDEGDARAVRRVAERLGHALGHPVRVEIRTGARAVAGVLEAATAQPDGYTLLVTHTAGLALAARREEDGRFDPRRSLAPAAMIGREPFVVVAHESAPFRSLKQFADLARISPGTLRYGAGAEGSAARLAALRFVAASGIEVYRAPHRDARQSLSAVLSRRVDVAVSTLAVVRGYARWGRLRALVLSGTERSPALPGVASAAEEGVKGFDAVLNHGLLVPAGTPAAAIGRLHHEISAMLREDRTRGALSGDGITPLPLSVPQYAVLVAADLFEWAAVPREPRARGR